MSVKRTEILDALYVRLAGIPGIKTPSRRLRSFEDVQPTEMPYLCLNSAAQTVEPQRGLPSKVTLKVDLYLYVHDSSTEGPWRLLNDLITEIEANLERQPGEARVADARFMDPTHNSTTLGGLVSNCAIAGEITTDEGALGDVGVAIIPLSITTTS